MSHTPTCRRCGNKHFNYQDCTTVFGSADSSIPEGFRLLKGGKNTTSLYPVPPGFRPWNDPPDKAA